MKHFVLFFIFSFFIVFNMNVNAKVEQSLNEYKIEQQQKSIDELKAEIKELKKEIDDTKEKKIGNEKDNESLDKRIGDISGNVDRFGIIVTTFGVLITAILFGLGFVAYRNAKADAKDEAEKVTKDWIEKDGKEKLSEMITTLEQKAQKEISIAVKTAKDEIKQQSEAAELFMQGNSHYYNKEYSKAEECYKKAVDAGDNKALFNLGNLYNEQKEYSKAEECYKKAVDAGDNKALKNLSILYFQLVKESHEALNLIQEYYKTHKEEDDIHTLATILLWNEEFTKSYEKFEEWMEYEGALESLNDMSEYLNLLIAKAQYYKAKEYFENEKYQLKDKLKPIWYALMILMQDEFPNEIKKMGSELQTSVDDILKTIEEVKQKYKI